MARKTVGYTPSPEGMLAQRRKQRRDLEEIKLYQLITEEKLDLSKKDDYNYISEIAETLEWSHGRVEKALARIWAEARRDIARQIKLKAKNAAE